MLHLPPVVPGGGTLDGLDDRREARKVARILRQLPGVFMVASHRHRGGIRRWMGLDVALVGPSDILWGDLAAPTRPSLEHR